MPSPKYVCLHGHFYQPPRENPWLEEVEMQDSASPFHDWNERIAAQCYSTNASSRILDGEGRIVEIVNNYSRMSFNFGPTLLSWMQRRLPQTYEAVIEADTVSRERFGGHGSAIAQAHSHLILPLAPRRDKATQITWGIRDFADRFGRDPEGMWLPEAAVDLETLSLLASSGIKFTILAPNQAKATRTARSKKWAELENGAVDPTTPYLCQLPGGGSIALFFYDGPIARDLAFGGMLDSGETFAERLLDAFNGERPHPQLVHIATDGESYGHHHRFGEMALSYCLEKIERTPDVALTVYGQFLEDHPPVYEVEIWENSSWSCAHGVERWRSDCGCNSGMKQGWTQGWRKPLRDTLDRLRDKLDGYYEAEAKAFFAEPWAVRDRYAEVLLDRSFESVTGFLDREAGRELSPEERIRALKLLEMEKCGLYMFTSCGWFFDEISGIETVQVLQYAYRAVQLARELGGPDLEGELAGGLEAAPSNVLQNGREAFERYAKPAAVDLFRLGAHYAMSSVFEAYPGEVDIACYVARSEDYDRQNAGRAALATGSATVSSRVTLEALGISFAVLHLGDSNLRCGVKPRGDPADMEEIRNALKEPFERGDVSESMRRLDEQFANSVFSLRDLFRDEQRKVVDEIMKPTYESVEADYRKIFESNYQTLAFLSWLNIPLPGSIRSAGEMVRNMELRRIFEAAAGDGEGVDLERLGQLADDVVKFGLPLDQEALNFSASCWLKAEARRLREDFGNIGILAELRDVLAKCDAMGASLDLWEVQNAFFMASRARLAVEEGKPAQGDERAKEWLALHGELAARLGVRVTDGADASKAATDAKATDEQTGAGDQDGSGNQEGIGA